MIALSSAERYYVYSEPTDGRKGYHSLSGLVRNNLNRRSNISLALAASL